MKRLEWILCAICYRIVILLLLVPDWGGRPAVRWAVLWLLQWGGIYAHTDDFETYRRERTGFMTCAEE